MRPSSQPARFRTDGPRPWRSWFVCPDDMGRWPMLALDGPLALASDAPLALRKIGRAQFFRQRQRRALTPAWGYAPGNVSENKMRAESPFHQIAMRHTSQYARFRTDGPRPWRSWFICPDDMGRWPMLVLDGPLALASDAPLALGENWAGTILSSAPTARSQTSLGQRPRQRVGNKMRAESLFHQIAMRPSSQHARCRTDGPRRWRSWFVCADDMGRRPMLVLDGPLALASDAPLALGENWAGTIPGTLPQAGMNRAFGPNSKPCHNH